MFQATGNPRHLWRRYTFAVLAIFVLISAEYVASYAGHAEEGRFASAINKSGSQRMLSQRILFFGSQVIADPADDVVLAEFVTTIDRFESAHLALTRGDGLRLSERLTGSMQELYVAWEVEHGLDALIATYISDARILAGGDAALMEDAWWRLVQVGSYELVEKLDDAVRAFEARAYVDVQHYHTIETATYGMALVILLAEALFIFWPAHRSINTTLDQLEVTAHGLVRAERAARARLREAVAARREAERADEAKACFLANMSHEIRTPMNAVLGMAYALEKTDLDDDQRAKLEVINTAGDGLVAVINDILDLSKVEAGLLDLESTEFSPAKLVSEVVALHEIEAQAKGLSLSVTMPGLAGEIYVGDPTRIRQVLTNLTSNALKFTSDGEVAIDVRCAHARSDGRTELMFSVRDTGLGITPEVATTLFAPFVQADVSTTREYGGTGLGLAISKQLCELMGGWIEVDSEPGKGSTFRFCIPMEHVTSAANDSAEVGSPEPHENASEGVASEGDVVERRLRILAAEDNETNRRVLEAMLSEIDVDVTFAENGREAVQAWVDGAFDMILMDVHMPVMDGVTATQKIRQIEDIMQRPRTPIIAVTADAMNHQAENHFEVGMDFHVAKPIKAQALFEAITAAVALGAESEASGENSATA